MRVPAYLPTLIIVVGGLLAHVVQAGHEARHVSMLSRGCGKEANAEVRQGDDPTEFTMQSHAGGGERQFLLHLPVGYSPKDPSSLILSFHGKGQTIFEMEYETQMSNSEFNNRSIVVYPKGIKVRRSQLGICLELTISRSNGVVTLKHLHLVKSMISNLSRTCLTISRRTTASIPAVSTPPASQTEED